MDDRRPGEDGSLRDRFATLAKQKPVAPRMRNWVWLAVGGAVLAITLSQLLGLSKNPVEERIREGVAERQAEKEARKKAEAASATPAHVGLDESVPLPAGLPADFDSSLRVALAVAAKPDLDVARRAIAQLPALAAKAPEDRRREVRTFLLRRLEPLLRAGVDAPLAEEARAAASEILTADPASDPGAAPPR